MTSPPRRMFEVGVEGDRFRPHDENPSCVEHGCMPVNPGPSGDASQRLLASRAYAPMEAARGRTPSGWEGLHTAMAVADVLVPALRLQTAAQAVVGAYDGMETGPTFGATLATLREAVQALEAALRGETTAIRLRFDQRMSRLRAAIDALYHLHDADVEDIADTLAQFHLELSS